MSKNVTPRNILCIVAEVLQKQKKIYDVRPEKSSLVSGNGPSENFFITYRSFPLAYLFVQIYVFSPLNNIR